jgi:hypothetical protein
MPRGGTTMTGRYNFEITSFLCNFVIYFVIVLKDDVLSALHGASRNVPVCARKKLFVASDHWIIVLNLWFECLYNCLWPPKSIFSQGQWHKLHWRYRLNTLNFTREQHSRRSQRPRGLRHERLRQLKHSDPGFEPHSRHGYLFASFRSVCCPV